MPRDIYEPPPRRVPAVSRRAFDVVRRLDELIERPEGVGAPSDWGRQEVMRARFEPLLADLELRTRTVQLCFPDAATFYDALRAPAHARNTGSGVEIDARYLLAIGRRPR